MDQAVTVVKDRLTAEMKDYLSISYTLEEVHMAIMGMKGLAAPGSDGLPGLFYHNYWDIIGKDVTEAILQVLNNGDNPSQYNSTNICLIPKVKNPIDLYPYAMLSVKSLQKLLPTDSKLSSLISLAKTRVPLSKIGLSSLRSLTISTTPTGKRVLLA
jgi:hypothetical protein